MTTLRAILTAFLLMPADSPASPPSVSGTVRDEAGRVVAGVTFRMREVGTGRHITFATSEAGRFLQTHTAPGLYDVHVEKRGYRPVHEAIRIDAGRDARLDVTLLPFPPGAEVAFERGIAAFNGDDSEMAAEALEEASRLAPDIVEVRINLGLVYLKLSRPDDASREFETAAVLGRARPHGHLDLAVTLGSAYASIGRTDLAIAWYERALSLQREWPAALFGLAKCYAITRPSKAVALFRRVIATAPRSAEAAQARIALGGPPR